MSEETRAKMSKAKLGNKIMVGRHLTRAWKENIRQAILGKHMSEETKAKHRAWWADEDWANRQKMLQQQGMFLKPNIPETIVLELLNTLYPNEWEYTGDGKIAIERLIPDFINTNGRKLIIEVFGDYWHSKGIRYHATEEGRQKVFAKYGYKLLVLWESDIKTNIEKVKADVALFIGGASSLS